MSICIFEIPCWIATKLTGLFNIKWRGKPIIEYYETNSYGTVSGFTSPVPGLVGCLEMVGVFIFVALFLLCVCLCEVVPVVILKLIHGV